jgi:hypothetical protein
MARVTRPTDTSNELPRSGTYGIVPREVLIDRTLPAKAVVTYGVLALYANTNRGARPSVGTLAKLIGSDRRDVQRWLRLLVDAGHLQRTPHRHRDGRGGQGSNEYVLSTPQGGAGEIPAPEVESEGEGVGKIPAPGAGKKTAPSAGKIPAQNKVLEQTSRTDVSGNKRVASRRERKPSTSTPAPEGESPRPDPIPDDVLDRMRTLRGGRERKVAAG